MATPPKSELQIMNFFSNLFPMLFGVFHEHTRVIRPESQETEISPLIADNVLLHSKHDLSYDREKRRDNDTPMSRETHNRKSLIP